jgi:hypothetical protein
MLMADSSTRFSSISISPVSERRRKWPRSDRAADNDELPSPHGLSLRL